MSVAEMFNRDEVRKGRTEELDESHALKWCVKWTLSLDRKMVDLR